jgi:hypothetical protein
MPMLRVVLLFLAAALSRDPDSGIYAIWLRDAQSVDLPYVKGGQVMAQWRNVEPEEGRYDFSSIDQQLAVQQKLGRKSTVQINGNQHPEWLFERVPFTTEKLSVQVNDRQGTLAYWHPAYRAAYLKLIAAYGEHIRGSRLRKTVVGIRLNFIAVGTEHVEVAEPFKSASAWTLPAGVDPPPTWTRELMEDYRRAVVEAFVKAFAPDVRIFVRNNLFATPRTSDPDWVRMLQGGKLALFHTSSEMEPRNGGAGQYQAFIRFCRSGQTVCYAEPWADARGNHGGKKDPRWSSPEQFNYWRVLVDLHCGVSFIALYGADLERAREPEFRAAFDFAARYAGYHASPSRSPGAWVALREGNNLKGDYTFLMQRDSLPPMRPLKLAGPSDQRYGAWARVLSAGATARFTLEPAFARSLAGGRPVVRVVYLDSGNDVFTVAGTKVIRTNTERWQSAEVPLIKTAEPITVTTTSELILHMVEVRR